MFDFIGDILGNLLGGAVADEVKDRMRSRQGPLPCAVRVLDGNQSGLSHRWRHGKAAVSPGSIDFHPRRPWARTIAIGVRSVSRLHERPARGAELWWLDHRLRIVEVSSATATLEWAVFGDQLRTALAEIRTQPEGK